VNAGKDTFLKTTRKIAEYVGRVYTDAGEYRLAMINLDLAPLVEPALPADNANAMVIEIWKMSRRTHDKKIEALDRNEQGICSLTLGQCSKALRNRMHDKDSNIIGLLTIIQVCMTLCQTCKNEVHSLFEAEAAILSYKQNKTSNHDTFEKFKDNVSTAERLGSDIRQQSILDDIADNAEEPTAIELGIARRAAKDRYLAICFLMNSDQRHYGGLIRDIENKHTRGTGTYPSTLGGAFDYRLVNYKGLGE
jgi:hypothetical protein